MPHKINVFFQKHKILGIIFFAILTATASHIKINLNFTPVPITAQSLVVLLSGVFLGSIYGALTQMVFILAGIFGLPVFSQPLPGMMIFSSPTGGYLFGFILAAFVSGILFEKVHPIKWRTLFMTLLLASLFILIPGTLWLSVIKQSSFIETLRVGFWPFMVGNVLKCGMGAMIIRFSGQNCA